MIQTKNLLFISLKFCGIFSYGVSSALNKITSQYLGHLTLFIFSAGKQEISLKKTSSLLSNSDSKKYLAEEPINVDKWYAETAQIQLF